MNTHLGLSPSERKAQAEALAGPDWLANPACRPPVLLCGDLNALPNAPACRKLDGRLKNVDATEPKSTRGGTFFARFPFVRIDHIFASNHVAVEVVEIPSSSLTRVASDHLPLIADLCLNAESKAITEGTRKQHMGSGTAVSLGA